MKRPLKEVTLDFNREYENFDSMPQYYISPVIDGGETDCTWHRMRIRHTVPHGVLFNINIYASNQKYIIHRGKVFELPELISNTELTEEQKDEYMSKALAGSYSNPSDILLHRARGRYFWFRIKCSGNHHIENLSVSFPAQSPLKYLPEIYQSEPLSDSFADHYLSIFMSLYDDLETEIDMSSALIDADSCPTSFLPWLADWLAIGNSYLWKGERLRKIIAATPELYRLRGTIQGINRLLSLYCEATYFFVEGFKLMRHKDSVQWKTLKRLFPTDRFSFLVLVAGNINETQERALKHLIDTNKPAHTKAEMRVLRRRVILDNDSYLGVNTVLSSIGKARLDGKSPLNYAVAATTE